LPAIDEAIEEMFQPLMDTLVMTLKWRSLQ
jgi:hypothetical protein